MENNRIQILKEILLDLHHGASPESVQERFNQHFKGVSALEISMMAVSYTHLTLPTN